MLYYQFAFADGKLLRLFWGERTNLSVLFKEAILPHHKQIDELIASGQTKGHFLAHRLRDAGFATAQIMAALAAKGYHVIHHPLDDHEIVDQIEVSVTPIGEGEPTNTEKVYVPKKE